MLLLAIPGSIPRLGEYLPGQLINWGAGLMAGQAAAYWPAVWISAGIIVFALAAAGLIFQKQEL